MRFSTILAAATAPLLASAAPVKVTRALSDASVTVIKFAEVLEQLETAFYTQALQKFVSQDFINAGITVPDVAIQTFTDIMNHEASHVTFLDTALSDDGVSPISGCSFNFDPVLTDVATMASVARVVEHVGVSAYLGGADIIDDKNVLAAAAAILTTESRHQSFLNVINGATVIPQAFDVALTPSDVLTIASAFITGCDVSGQLNIPANQPLGIQNTGPVGSGTLLSFSSPALNSTTQSTAFCQMLLGDQQPARVFPLNECVVPSGINGPVWIWLTTSNQPLLPDIHIRETDSILAGPTAAFIDSQSDALGALVRSGSGFNSSQTISPSDAQGQLQSASGTTLFATATPVAGSTDTATPAAGTDTATATVGDSNAQVTAAPALETTAAGAVPPISVIGVTQIPA